MKGYIISSHMKADKMSQASNCIPGKATQNNATLNPNTSVHTNFISTSMYSSKKSATDINPDVHAAQQGFVGGGGAPEAAADVSRRWRLGEHVLYPKIALNPKV